MKPYLLAVLAALTFGACGKKNDVHVLQEEAVMVAKYYQPRLDALESRVQAIFKRGSTIPGNLPGIEDVGRRLQEARDTLLQLRGIIGTGPDGKSAVEKQADAAAKAGKLVDLQKLVHDTETMVERGLTIINDDLDSVESWISNYDRKTLAMTAAAPTGQTEPGTQPNPEAPQVQPQPPQPAPPVQ